MTSRIRAGQRCRHGSAAAGPVVVLVAGGCHGATVRPRPGSRYATRSSQAGASTLAAIRADLDEHRSAFLDALLARDSERARRAIDAALAAGTPIPGRLSRSPRPGARRDRPPLGHGRAQRRRGALRDGDGAVAARRAERAAPARRARRPAGRGHGTPAEQHALGARMVADFLEADGWEVLLLGPGAPAQDLVELVDLERPHLVALSTSTAGVLPGVVEVLARAAALRPRPFIVVGGPVLDGRRPERAEVGADARHPRPARARGDPARARPAGLVGRSQRIPDTKSMTSGGLGRHAGERDDETLGVVAVLRGRPAAVALGESILPPEGYRPLDPSATRTVASRPWPR